MPRGAALSFSDFEERKMDITEICIRPKSEHVEETDSSVARSHSLLGKFALLYFYNHVTSQRAIKSTGFLFVFHSPQHHWARTSQRRRVTQGVFPTLGSLRRGQAGWRVHSILPGRGTRRAGEGMHPTLGGHSHYQTLPKLAEPGRLHRGSPAQRSRP